ncbi:leucine-rich repeat domain-containing protein [Dolichospermum sp. LEGE 00240]|uniref:leucine-rich repeat domain-containing protein n=1 Tax=Dolichospermum sp. LEGE 00240 TaxID=1828603 RepID=UPI00187F9B49|nr:leucine-rich repeat domain-containing protein [Dolichospermum sp. LEGE 00240]MBE9252128.1 leucine-rich repeat domain-containing protein [Dolichospermum sp. LEGE 00240]
MKLSLVATTIFTLTLGFYTPKVTAAPIKTPKTFKEWCQQKASLPQETKRTVEALLNVAETRNCSQANQTLTNLTFLYLWENQISDIKPLSNLTNLTLLDLWENKISDIKPLSNLTNLTSLSLSGNKISDIKPWSNLTNLAYLYLAKNPLIVKQCPLKPESICKF